VIPQLKDKGYHAKKVGKSFGKNTVKSQAHLGHVAEQLAQFLAFFPATDLEVGNAKRKITIYVDECCGRWIRIRE
jgi:hypothetical protein